MYCEFNTYNIHYCKLLNVSEKIKLCKQFVFQVYTLSASIHILDILKGNSTMYSEKVADILDYVKDNPLDVKSQKMFYGLYHIHAFVYILYNL